MSPPNLAVTSQPRLFLRSPTRVCKKNDATTTSTGFGRTDHLPEADCLAAAVVESDHIVRAHRLAGSDRQGVGGTVGRPHGLARGESEVDVLSRRVFSSSPDSHDAIETNAQFSYSFFPYRLSSPLDSPRSAQPTMYPTGSPTITARPTVSPAPTSSPSISSSPTISPAPTVSHSPSAAPSFAPTGSPQGTPTGEPSDSPIATPMPTDEEPPADIEEEVVEGGLVEEENDADVAEVVVVPPEEVSGGPATRPVRTAALAASLFLGAVGAFWTVA